MGLRMLSGKDAGNAANGFALGMRRVRVSQVTEILYDDSTSTHASSSTAYLG